VKLSGPDYENVSREEAIQDFKKRIVNYEKVYESLSDEEEKDEISYVKIINIGKKSIAYNIQGYLQSHCVFYLMQLNIKKRTIWLTRQ
jgi:6-phosphofructo-2-kinase